MWAVRRPAPIQQAFLAGLGVRARQPVLAYAAGITTAAAAVVALRGTPLMGAMVAHTLTAAQLALEAQAAAEVVAEAVRLIGAAVEAALVFLAKVLAALRALMLLAAAAAALAGQVAPVDLAVLLAVREAAVEAGAAVALAVLVVTAVFASYGREQPAPSHQLM
jgi:hypothetical protein